jgi:hypothetical protein
MKILALSIVIASGVAAAQPLDPAHKDRAAALVTEGSKSFAAQDFQGALDRYDEAFKLYPSPKIRFNRALALDKLHREAEAADELDRFLAQATDAPPDALDQARRVLASLDQTVGKLSMTSAIVAEAIVDGRAVGTTPATVHLAAGSHVVALSATGYQTWTQTMNIVAGQTTQANPRLDRVRLEVTEPPPPPVIVKQPEPTPEHPPESTPIYKRWWLWTAVGVVAAGSVTAFLVTRPPKAPATELGTFRPGL